MDQSLDKFSRLKMDFTTKLVLLKRGKIWACKRLLKPNLQIPEDSNIGRVVAQLKIVNFKDA